MAKALPNTLPSPDAQRALDSTNRSGNTANHNKLQELPQTTSAETPVADFVNQPNSEGPTATETGIAVTAEDPSASKDFFWRTGIIVAKGQSAMGIEHSNAPAMRTGDYFQPFLNRNPIVGITKEPLQLHT